MNYPSLKNCIIQIQKLVRFLLFLGTSLTLVPGIIFWSAFFLLRCDSAALALAMDNLTSRFLAASMADRQNFLNLCLVGGFVILLIVLFFRWPSFNQHLKLNQIAVKEKGNE